MKVKKRRYLFIVILIATIGLAVYGYSAWNRELATASDAKPDFKVAAAALGAAFTDNEVEANKKYLGKILMINGAIVALTNQADTFFSVVLGDAEALTSISCELDKRLKPDLNKYKVGDSINIIGTCVGYLADVEITNAAIITASKKINK